MYRKKVRKQLNYVTKVMETYKKYLGPNDPIQQKYISYNLRKPIRIYNLKMDHFAT